VAEITRKRFWLNRIARTGTGAMLGHYPYEQIGVPEEPEPLDMNALLASGAVAEVSHA
jgi:hypothetical protein